MNKKIKWIFIGLAAVVVIGFVVVWALLFTPSYTPKDAEFSSAQEREQVAQNLEQKLSQFDTQVPPSAVPNAAPAPYSPPAAPGRVVQVEVTQREANAFLQTMLERQIAENQKLREAGLTDPAIAFENGKVILTARVEQAGMKLPVTMTVDLRMAGESTVSYTIQDLKVGRLGLPDDARARIESEMGKSVGQAGTFKLPEGIRNLQVQNGQIIVQGVGK